MSAQELFDLTDKVAIITGGAGGIGIVYAEALCEAGAAVVIADVNAQAADEAAAGLVAKGHKAVGTVVDVRSPESTEAMAQAAVDAFGGIDILINNAAIMTDLPPFGLANMPYDEWNRVMDVNVNAIAPGLVDNDSGYASLPKDSPFRDAIAAQIPGKPSGPPTDLVGALLLLCSRAGDWITGQTILIDGGWITRL